MNIYTDPQTADDLVYVDILDNEPNSQDQEAFLDLALSKASPNYRYFRQMFANKTHYQIPKTVWDDTDFQKQLILIKLTLEAAEC